jgi:hypothetical protein
MRSAPLLRRLGRLWPVLLGAAWLLLLLGGLVPPDRALANRDIAIFHLPLRAIFKDLAELGPPVWNPWLHGGQPVLSNPSYGAFYPPSWLVFLVPPTYALSLMALLHLAVAFAGAWRLARHLGCGRGAAALAAVGFTGCGAYLSLLSAYTLFGSMAWLPWVLAWGDESLRSPEGGRWWRPGLLAGGALGLQLLNGEPATMMMSGLALLALTLSAAARRPRAAPRILLPAAFALALAAVQFLPTLGHLAGSQRKGLPPEIATMWSMRPQRFVEVLLPRFFGDPARDSESLFFGWRINEGDYPYVESLYPGLALAVLGLAALPAWRIPRRAAWLLCLAAGCLLALGHNGPVYEGLRRAVPALAAIRYPEKFIVLAVLTLVFAGALGWQRLLDRREADREADRRGAAGLPLALALGVLAAALALTALLHWAPAAALGFISSYGPPDLTAAGRAKALSYLRSEAWAAAATAAAVAALFALSRWRRPSRRLLEALAVLVLAADLWHYGHALVRTVPAAVYRDPPPLALTVTASRDRVFVQEARARAPFLLRERGDAQTLDTRANLLTLEPYSSLLWHIPSAFDVDFEMFLTAWGRRAEDILLGEEPGSQRLHRYLGVWKVRTFLLHKTLEEQLAAFRDPAALPLHRVTNLHVLPRFRFAPRVTFHADHAAALAAARAAGWKVARHDHWVRPGERRQTVGHTRPPRPLEIADEGRRIEMRYRAPEGALFVAAMTYDRGWLAAVDGEPVATYPTAACQLGVALPAGEHRLVLLYREPLLLPGAAVSLGALAAGAVALLVPGRRRRMA